MCGSDTPMPPGPCGPASPHTQAAHAPATHAAVKQHTASCMLMHLRQHRHPPCSGRLAAAPQALRVGARVRPAPHIALLHIVSSLCRCNGCDSLHPAGCTAQQSWAPLLRGLCLSGTRHHTLLPLQLPHSRTAAYSSCAARQAACRQCTTTTAATALVPAPAAAAMAPLTRPWARACCPREACRGTAAGAVQQARQCVSRKGCRCQLAPASCRWWAACELPAPTPPTHRGRAPPHQHTRARAPQRTNTHTYTRARPSAPTHTHTHARAHLKRFGGSRLRRSFLLRTRTTLLWIAALTQ
jgi:hypothetical protein